MFGGVLSSVFLRVLRTSVLAREGVDIVDRQTGLPESTPPDRACWFAGASGDFDRFAQDLACLGDEGGRHGVWYGWWIVTDGSRVREKRTLS